MPNEVAKLRARPRAGAGQMLDVVQVVSSAGKLKGRGQTGNPGASAMASWYVRRGVKVVGPFVVVEPQGLPTIGFDPLPQYP